MKSEMKKDAPTQAVGGPFAWLVQSTSERNPPHGWAVHMFNGQNERDAVPVYLQQEVDRLRAERDEHARWRQDLADKLDEVERHRDAIGVALNKLDGPFRLLIAACNRLSAEAEEYDFDDGMGRGAMQSYWDEFEDALEKARDVIGENE